MINHPQQEVVEYPITPNILEELKSLLTTVIPTDIADPQEIQQTIIKIIETGWNFNNLPSNLYEQMVASSVKANLIQAYGNEGLSGLLTALIERLTMYLG